VISLGLVLAAVVGSQAPPSPSPEPSPPISARATPQPGVPSPVVPPSDPTLEDLYRSILPPPIGDPEPLAAEDPGGQAPGAAGVTRDDGARDGLYLGRVQLTPAFHALYVRAEGALLETAEPVEDRYYEMRPQIRAEMPVSTGFLRGGYQAGIRRGSSFDVVESTITHLADLSLDLPLGGIGEITGAEHFARGVLETAEVDPGREYFFRLGRFTRHRHSLGLRLLPGGRADVTAGGSLDVVRVDDQAAFFDHEQQAVSAQLGYEVTPALRAALGYGYTRIPFTVERPQAESHMHAAFGELRGEILPLTTGNVSVGYSSQTSPNAGPGGTRFTGLTASGSLEKSFTPSSSLTLAGTRATHASSFEQNAFYVTSAVAVLLRGGLPWSLALEAGAGYHRNSYRTVASSIGAQRRDEIRGWTLGLGRPVTRYALVRADYRRERRDSNIDAFDSRSNALTVQLGVGVFAPR
jgi:putative beta-barrel porin BBP2